MNSMMENVNRGAALLDRECPGWENKIDLRMLDLSSVNDCVLGQIFGGDSGYRSGYSYGRDVLGVDYIQASIDHGFSLGCDPIAWSYRSLTDEWKHLIATRRVKADYHDYELVA